jgi:predicted Rossmann fold flavoprotein
LRVSIAEKSNKVLAKVRISGGGRCNVTHNQTDLTELLKNYPRGKNLLKWVLRKWSVTNTIRWFETHGVQLKTEEDGRMFPITDDSRTIVGALQNAAEQLGAEVWLSCGVDRIEKTDSGFICHEGKDQILARKIILATGGFPKSEHYNFLREMGLEIVEPVPSLFTFNIPMPSLHAMQGISTPWGRIKVAGHEGWYEGPILITHWGLSGPAVLKASAFLARELQESNYNFSTLVDWTGLGEETAREHFVSHLLMHSAKQIGNANPFEFPRKLWEYLIETAGLDASKLCRNLNKTEKGKLLELCIRSPYHALGKTTFKEEFVTAGGIALKDIDANTMQAKNIPGLYFAGEIIDLDGVTGGYNFQAAWATGYVAGSSAVK